MAKDKGNGKGSDKPAPALAAQTHVKGATQWVSEPEAVSRILIHRDILQKTLRAQIHTKTARSGAVSL